MENRKKKEIKNSMDITIQIGKQFSANINQNS